VPTHGFDIENMGGTPEKVRERVQIAGSGTVLAEIAKVINAQPAGTEYGLVVRPTSAPFATGDDTYTAGGNGVALDASKAPVKHFSLQVVGTGAAASAWIVALEISLDNANWTEILRHVTADGDGVVLSAGPAPFPALFLRSRCVSVTLGGATNIVATILGVS
jgi:hypothetical protein